MLTSILYRLLWILLLVGTAKWLARRQLATRSVSIAVEQFHSIEAARVGRLGPDDNANTSHQHRLRTEEGPYSEAQAQRDWDTSLARGCRLFGYMDYNAGSDDALASTYNEPKLLGSYGWTVQRFDTLPESAKDLGKALTEGAGAPADDEDETPTGGQTVLWLQSEESEFKYPDSEGDMVPYNPTFARYNNVFWAKEGIIVADNTWSPQAIVSNPNGPFSFSPFEGELVPLAQWSDVTYLEWLSQTSGSSTQRKNINAIFRANVANSTTKNVVAKALKSRGKDVASPWPGDEFQWNSVYSQALLGTPNGVGVAWFLLQHQGDEQLGHRTVDSIVVFEAGEHNAEAVDVESTSPSLLFKIKTYDPNHSGG